jgi:two-component system chemotaxis response regulator CheB
VRFRCHVGHAFHAETLFAEQSHALEAALWTSVRTFKERNLLARQLAARERHRGDGEAAARFEEQAEQAARYGDLIQRYILNGSPLPAKVEELPGTTEKSDTA